MLAYVKHGQRHVGNVIGTVGFSLVVSCPGGCGREVVTIHEAEDREAFLAEWQRRSPLSEVEWHTDDGDEQFKLAPR